VHVILRGAPTREEEDDVARDDRTHVHPDANEAGLVILLENVLAA